MTTYTSKAEIKNVVENAEKTLTECFEFVLSIKHTRDYASQFLNFQPMLATCLFELMEFYHKLQNEKDDLIGQKKDYTVEQFKANMKENSIYLKAIREIIEIGKSIGDAFAWLFYSSNKDELEMHFKHESTGLFVRGIGGVGELEFIKNNQIIDGMFVIYHGITNILRVGDFSLFDIKNGIMGIGELKTQEDKNHLEIYAFITSRVKVNLNNSQFDINTFSEAISELERSMPKRVKQIEEQIEKQTDLLKASQCDKSLGIQANYEHHLLDMLTCNESYAYNADSSLMLYGLHYPKNCFFEMLTEDELTVESISNSDELVRKVEQILMPSSQYNEIIMGVIDTKMNHMRTPLLWWDVSDEICKNLYFKKLAILTFFNPAKLLELFVTEGFSIVKLGDLSEIEIEKIENEVKIGIGHFEMICDLINHSLLFTEDVFSLVTHVMDAHRMDENIMDNKIELHIRLDNFRKGIDS